MKNEWLRGAVIAGALLTAPAWAGDGKMKDCMARQKAQNSSASMDDMKKACKDEMRSHGDHAMKSDAPNPTTPTTKGDPAPQTGSQGNPPQ